jgi:hypothetical protein
MSAVELLKRGSHPARICSARMEITSLYRHILHGRHGKPHGKKEEGIIMTTEPPIPVTLIDSVALMLHCPRGEDKCSECRKLAGKIVDIVIRQHEAERDKQGGDVVERVGYLDVSKAPIAVMGEPRGRLSASVRKENAGSNPASPATVCPFHGTQHLDGSYTREPKPGCKHCDPDLSREIRLLKRGVREARFLVAISGESRMSRIVSGISGVCDAYLELLLGQHPLSEETHDSRTAKEEIWDADNWCGDYFEYSESFEDCGFMAIRITEEEAPKPVSSGVSLSGLCEKLKTVSLDGRYWPEQIVKDVLDAAGVKYGE